MSAKKMRCGRCNRPITHETSVYSPFRQIYYCSPPWHFCDAEHKRLVALAAKAEKDAAK